MKKTNNTKRVKDIIPSTDSIHSMDNSLKLKKLKTSKRSDQDGKTRLKTKSNDRIDEEEEDPYIKAENMEIKRLEKLLGLSKKTSTTSAAEKLNKEYTENEGMEEGFGDFLLDLDSLSSNIKKYKNKNNLKSIKTAAVSIDDIDPAGYASEEEISLTANKNRSDLMENSGPTNLGSLTVVQDDESESDEAPNLVELNRNPGNGLDSDSDLESDNYSDFDADDLPEDDDDFLESDEEEQERGSGSDEEEQERGSESDEEEDEREYMLTQLINMFVADHKGKEPDAEDMEMLEAQVDDMLGSAEYDSDMEVDDSLNGVDDGDSSEGSYDEEISVSDKSCDEDGSNESDSYDEVKAVDTREGTFYKPKAGEDIYGRAIDTNASDGTVKKYIPPGKRAQMGLGLVSANAEGSELKTSQTLQLIDESSEHIKTLRRTMNGFLNRLSDQSKDSITKSIKNLFEQNSRTVTNHVFRDGILAICGNSTQVMTTLIPLYAAILSALHCTVSIDIGSFIVEHVVLELVRIIDTIRLELKRNDAHLTSTEAHALISDKKPLNYLLVVCYLYNMKVLHHTLIVDLIYYLLKTTPIDPTTNTTGSGGSGGGSGTRSENDLNSRVVYTELEMELVVLILTYCGSYIRQDDPACILHIFNVINNYLKSNTNSNTSNNPNSSRLKFMMDIIKDVKNNKSMLTTSKNSYGATAAIALEETKRLRKWLGQIKQQLNMVSKTSGQYNATSSSTGNVALTFTLQDLRDAESRGRWWKAGASWMGKREEITNTNTNTTNIHDNSDDHKKNKKNGSLKIEETKRNLTTTKPFSAEEEMLYNIAANMRGMNVGIRKHIFVSVMSAMDLDDAFEKIQHMRLNSKQDRDVVRVLIECCISEMTPPTTSTSNTTPVFNRFYAELSILLCNHNRQYRTSFQYAFWDIFKQLKNGGCEDFIDSSNKKSKKSDILYKQLHRYVNLGKLIAILVKSHTISLVSIMKCLDIQDLSNSNSNSKQSTLNCMITCLSSMFIDIIYDQNISLDIGNHNRIRTDTEETPLYETVFDRISTSKDYNLIRENCIYFLSKYMNIELHSERLMQCLSIYPYPEPNRVLIILRKRIKSIVKLLEAMSVLDMVVKSEEDEEADTNIGKSELSIKSKHRPDKPGKRKRSEDEAIMTMNDMRGVGGGEGMGTGKKFKKQKKR